MALTKINASVIANNTIAVGNIADNSVDATKIASNSILTRHIDDDQITGDQLADALTVVTSVTVPTIAASSNLTLDVAGDIILDADGGDWYFKDGGTQKAAFNQYGLGIGSASSAGYIIEGEGTGHQRINLRSSDNNTAGIYLQVKNSGNMTGNATLRTDSSGNFSIWTGTTSESQKVTVNASGNVGIGDTSPGAKLDVNSGTTNTMAHFHSTDDNGFIELKDNDTTAYIGVQDDYLYIGGVASRSASNLLINDGNGNVGIGGLPSNAKLEVVATSGEVLRADSNGGAYRLVATQTGVNLQGVVDVLGTTLIHGVSNYTGLEVKGTGASRPSIKFSNVTQGLQAQLYGTEGNALVIGTGTSSVAAMTIDSSQRVNMPGQPCFSAALPAAGTTAGNIIVWSGEHLDVGGHFNTSNGRFTAPIAGNYFFSFWILMDPSGAGHYSRVLFGKNGGYSTQWTDNLESTDAGATAAYHSVGGSAIIPMAANDYITLKNDGQSPTYGTEYGNWSGFLVS